MEIVAQWLDDLEDLLVACVLLAEQTRCRCLQLGLSAALALIVIVSSQPFTAWAGLCAGVAAGCVGLWCLAVVGPGILQVERRAQPA